MILQIIAGTLLLLILSIILFVNIAPQFGAKSKDNRLNRIINSPNFKDGKFQNLVPTPMSGENTSMWKNGLKFLKNEPGRVPEKTIETVKLDSHAFLNSKSEIAVSWFGHSSLLINFKGTIILTDPVFSETASPVSFLGVKRFDYSNQYQVEDLPAIDVVLISHDHFDHLDYNTIKQIHHKVKKFYVPLGVAAHLIHWGVDEEKIVELDWWENILSEENFNFISTPSRHFSGRKGFDKDYTLWCSWVIESGNSRIYYCGDSGYGDHFKQIGEKYGPFELTMMECGQYNEGWPYIHMMPEQSVQAHVDLKGKTMLPIHWGKFKLSLHSWTEPIERAQKEASRLGVNLLSPLPGEIVELNQAINDLELKKGNEKEVIELIESK